MMSPPLPPEAGAPQVGVCTRPTPHSVCTLGMCDPVSEESTLPPHTPGGQPGQGRSWGALHLSSTGGFRRQRPPTGMREAKTVKGLLCVSQLLWLKLLVFTAMNAGFVSQAGPGASRFEGSTPPDSRGALGLRQEGWPLCYQAHERVTSLPKTAVCSSNHWPTVLPGTEARPVLACKGGRSVSPLPCALFHHPRRWQDLVRNYRSHEKRERPGNAPLLQNTHTLYSISLSTKVFAFPGGALQGHPR